MHFISLGAVGTKKRRTRRHQAEGETPEKGKDYWVLVIHEPVDLDHAVKSGKYSNCSI